jgi:hypothetical protein
MMVMKNVRKMLFVNVENDIVCGDGSFKATVIHQIVVTGENKDAICCDVEFLDIENITFMGMPIKGYDEYRKFKAKMSDMGIDVEEMVDEACVGIISSEFIQECKNDLKKIL